MKQICDGYNPRVLMGNWYEESFALPQPARDNPSKVPRTKQVEIGFIDNKGKLRPLNTVSRLQPWNTNNLTIGTQPECNKLKTTNKQNFDLPTLQHFHYTFKGQPFAKTNNINTSNETYMKIDKFKRHHHLFNETNINQLLISRDSQNQSFKSGLRQNQHPEPRIFMQSVYQRDISKQGEFLNSNQRTNNQRDKQDEAAKSTFRRIRSEITLKNTTNFPLTYK